MGCLFSLGLKVQRIALWPRCVLGQNETLKQIQNDTF
jgi:hypothetical protein